VAVEGAGEETVDSKHFDGAQKLKLKKTFYPSDMESFLETVSTGATPDVHGVYARRAHHPAAGSSASLLVNFADVLSHSTDGQSLSLSLSFSPLSASALAPHVPEPHSNSALLSFNTTAQRVDGHGKCSSHFRQKKQQLLTLLAKLPYVSYSSSLNHFTISLPDATPAIFDLNKQADLSFAMELASSQLLAERLENSEDLQLLVRDEYPDSFALVFTSLKTFRASNQAKQEVARTFLMTHINSLIEQLNKTYSQRLSSQVLLSGSPRRCPFASLAQSLPAYINLKDLPYVYTSAADYEQVCRDLKASLNSSELDVLCLHQQLSHLRTRQTNDPSYDNLLFFQSIFWGIIGWIITIYLIVYAMASINGGKDTMLYRSSVQSRHPHSQ